MRRRDLQQADDLQDDFFSSSSIFHHSSNVFGLRTPSNHVKNNIVHTVWFVCSSVRIAVKLTLTKTMANPCDSDDTGMGPVPPKLPIKYPELVVENWWWKKIRTP
jgi:hypothetical protein